MIKLGNKRWWVVGVTGAVIAAIVIAKSRHGDSALGDVPTFMVQRGTLQINVLQGGEIRALKNYEVKSEIETPTKILSLIPEGYQITEEDVKDGKVLVELDGSDIKDKITTHDIDFQTTVSNYIDADENREIVKSENQSLVVDTKNTALFALMDFEKYLSKAAASALLKSRGLPETVEAFEKSVDSLEASVNAIARARPGDKETVVKVKAAVKLPQPKTAPIPMQRMDFLKLLDGNTSTDGQAQQTLRQLNDELLLHRSETAVSKQTVEASERLAAKDFINKAALENDRVNFEKVELSVKTAETSLDLFRKYEFPKQCEQLLSAYQQALQKLQRMIRTNRSRLAQAESKFQTAKRRYDMELAKKEDLERQLNACVIKAVQPGLVAYGPINNGPRFNEPIEEGAAVRLRQTILTIPDMTHMGVHVAIHESQVKKVKIEQGAVVRVDAEPSKVLVGKVAEIAVLPDSTSSRYTPNLKVYPCTIHIDGVHDWLKPGMNAKVEVIINQLDDILYVPVQSIEVDQDHHFCYVNNGSELERREIKTGSFNDDFIEVKDGLQSGENVALTIPKRTTLDAAEPTASPEPGHSDPKAKKPSKAVAKN
ncbi:MAG: hypothetical protein JWO89_1648 [Verrucomicrobiaceae bacterium]|nr:hypothetical protein [Verrucomicrobiaceae bacterium]